MNKKIIALSVFFGLSSAVSASDNTITFQGEVTDQTCSVTVNGNALSPVVLLPTVSISDFASSTTAGATAFEVGVSGCAVDARGAHSRRGSCVGSFFYPKKHSKARL